MRRDNMSYFKYKCSAIHNLIITKKSEQVSESNFNEGIVIPKILWRKQTFLMEKKL